MRITTIVVGAGLGAAGMYLLDPERGTARRVTLRDRTQHIGRNTWRWVRGVTAGVRNRARGLVIEYLARRLSVRPPDTVLVERVRSEMGHIVRHPHWVSVTADQGWIQLSGDVLCDEREPLLTRLRTLPGIVGIEHHLTERDQLESEVESMSVPTAATARAGT
jgi:hypothetical protein